MTMPSIRVRLGITALLLLAQLTILISGLAHQDAASAVAGGMGMLLSVGVGLVFWVDHRVISANRALTARNADNIQDIYAQMNVLQEKAHNQE
jgi:hypothetical protein